MHSRRDRLVYHISKQHPLIHRYVIHKEPQTLVLVVYLPFSKTMTQDLPHFLTTYTNSKGQPLPLHMNLHTDIMLLYQVLCSYFPGITKWESPDWQHSAGKWKPTGVQANIQTQYTGETLTSTPHSTHLLVR